MITSNIIDFIPSVELEEVYFKTLKNISTNLGDYQSHSMFWPDDDEKWNKFAKDHKLTCYEKHAGRWHDLYLRMCAVGLL